jgi:hypothetical protein
MGGVSKGIIVVGLGLAVAMTAFGGEKAAKKSGAKPGAGNANYTITDGKDHPTTRGTAWLQYDDGSLESWGTNFSGSFDAAGNKFTSTWGTFYCDMVSMFASWNNSGTSLYISAWNALSGTVLQNNTAIFGHVGTSGGSPVATGTGWVSVDGSTASVNWVGNSTYVFHNTAWIGNDFYASSAGDVGIDTNTTAGHGFLLTNYVGTGYAEQSWNAMIRARFNGTNVPVELAGFTVE